jgi:hypothetical protein
MIDELAGGRGLVPKIADAARRLRTRRPDLRGLWGAFVGSGPRTAYTAFNPPDAPAIDELLRADATLTLEFYPRYSAYCASATTVSGRDQWMADFFRGESGKFPQPRLRWLAARRRRLGSASRLTVLFPTTDVSPLDYLGRNEPADYLDRMFHVWATRSGFRGLMLAENGGIGTYEWDEAVMCVRGATGAADGLDSQAIADASIWTFGLVLARCAAGGTTARGSDPRRDRRRGAGGCRREGGFARPDARRARGPTAAGGAPRAHGRARV